MDADGSVTRWISPLKNGDRAAASPLWETKSSGTGNGVLTRLASAW
jgi:hypothetical protein